MRFIRKGGRVIPIKEKVESKGKRIGKGAVAGAKVGLGIAGGSIIGAHASRLAVHGHTTGSFKNLGKGLAVGIGIGAAVGAISGAFAKKKHNEFS